MATDQFKNLQDNASGPQSVSNGGESVSQFPVKDQIENTKFAMATRARTNSRTRGIAFTKLRPHGSVFPACDS
jgi:hypothetical protein